MAMMYRRPLKPGVRMEVLRRDKFTCQYCGAKAPDVIIQVDHITPVSLGGTDDPDNLKTACRDCNYGKSNKDIDSVECYSPETMRSVGIKFEDHLKPSIRKKCYQAGFRFPGMSEWVRVAVSEIIDTDIQSILSDEFKKQPKGKRGIFGNGSMTYTSIHFIEDTYNKIHKISANNGIAPSDFLRLAIIARLSKP